MFFDTKNQNTGRYDPLFWSFSSISKPQKKGSDSDRQQESCISFYEGYVRNLTSRIDSNNSFSDELETTSTPVEKKIGLQELIASLRDIGTEVVAFEAEALAEARIKMGTVKPENYYFAYESRKSELEDKKNALEFSKLCLEYVSFPNPENWKQKRFEQHKADIWAAIAPPKKLLTHPDALKKTRASYANTKDQWR